tara:strand:+ start:530 stop:718 length:189 start_codon:yes stop_codon:yes gene_type:complete
LRLRKEDFKDYIRVELSNSDDAKKVTKVIQDMRFDFMGRVELRTLKSRNSEIWRDELEILNI